MDKALDVCDRYTSRSFYDFVMEMDAGITAPAFKRPPVLRYVEALQEAMQKIGLVGKTTSVVDALKKANYELNYRQPPAGKRAGVILRPEDTKGKKPTGGCTRRFRRGPSGGMILLRGILGERIDLGWGRHYSPPTAFHRSGDQRRGYVVPDFR
ncbi:MAG TPA: hypothetical protein EYP62_03005 [Kiritimatiellae bacterium]|nr:hypothetical protein [Kiritimatiellia bacterium]